MPYPAGGKSRKQIHISIAILRKVRQRPQDYPGIGLATGHLIKIPPCGNDFNIAAVNLIAYLKTAGIVGHNSPTDFFSGIQRIIQCHHYDDRA